MNKPRSGSSSGLNGVGTAAKTPRMVLFDNGSPSGLVKKVFVNFYVGLFFFGHFVDMAYRIDRADCLA